MKGMVLIALALVATVLPGCKIRPGSSSLKEGGATTIANDVHRVTDSERGVTCYVYVGPNHRGSISCLRDP